MSSSRDSNEFYPDGDNAVIASLEDSDFEENIKRKPPVLSDSSSDEEPSKKKFGLNPYYPDITDYKL